MAQVKYVLLACQICCLYSTQPKIQFFQGIKTTTTLITEYGKPDEQLLTTTTAIYFFHLTENICSKSMTTDVFLLCSLCGLSASYANC